jgi:hypothetical protein
VNTVQKLCTHVSKCKNDNCWNYTRNQEREGWRRMFEKANSCMIYLIHCKNLWKFHNVPPPITTIKEKIKFKKETSKHHNRNLGWIESVKHQISHLRVQGSLLCSNTKGSFARYQWLTPVILATWEAETGRIEVRKQSRQIVCKTPPPKITREKMEWRCSSSSLVPFLQEQSPEFETPVLYPAPKKSYHITLQGNYWDKWENMQYKCVMEMSSSKVNEKQLITTFGKN